jgi:hypothetical protein
MLIPRLRFAAAFGVKQAGGAVKARQLRSAEHRLFE